jgi:hypothetical protein
VMSGGAGNDSIDGGSGNDWLFGGTGNDMLSGGAGADTLYAGEGNDVLNGDAGRDFLYGQQGNDRLSGAAGQDYLEGGAGSDDLAGDADEDVLRGGADNDSLSGGGANDLLEGGSGNDTLDGGDGNDFLAGGTGTDTVRPGAGRDVIVFNRGDGADTVDAIGAIEDTLSLGGRVRSSELTLAKNGQDLVLSVGSGDRITFKDWYAKGAARSIAKLQLICDSPMDSAESATHEASAPVQIFDFQRIVAAFDAARVRSPKLSTWSISSSLAGTLLEASDTEAIGGVLAHEYAASGSSALLSPDDALEALSDMSFGAHAQRFGFDTPSDNPPPCRNEPGEHRGMNKVDADPVRSLFGLFGKTAADESSQSCEEAIEAWLEQRNASVDAWGADDRVQGRSGSEFNIAVEWQRTRRLLEMHLQGTTGCWEDASEGMLVPTGPVAFSPRDLSCDALARVSGCQLKPLSGLEEGLRTLRA